MMYLKWIVCLLLLSVCVLRADAQMLVRVVEWNVENLFDTMHDTLKNDYDFMPDGRYHWTRSRYWRKLDDVAQTLTAVGGEQGLPMLVGLCEVENDTVMRDLTKRSALSSACYEYVMTDSPDRRGVDVVLMYQPFLFRILTSHSIRVPSVENVFVPTRDLLYVCGETLSRDTMHLIVCHLPSKANGGRAATRHRQLAVETMRSVVDSVMNISPAARMLVIGDFNADVGERIFKQLMPPLRETLPPKRTFFASPRGTYCYQNKWSYLDHILVSDGFCEWQSGVDISAREARLPFLLNEKGAPNRTYRGPSYNKGGISDHLPLYIDIMLR